MLNLLKAKTWGFDTDKIEYHKFLQRHAERLRYTVDICLLEEYDFQLFFCPDEFSTGGHMHDLVREASVGLGLAYTKDEYQFVQKNLEKQTFPIAMEDRRFRREKDLPITPLAEHIMAPYGKIRGELVALRPYQMIKLDEHKRNGVEFIRKRIHLAYPYRERYKQLDRDTNEYLMFEGGEIIHIIQAWMYVGVPEFWEPQFDAGYLFTHVKQFQSRATNRRWLRKPYYEFKCPVK